ncbi:bifunctional methylenetetrahydrofolate dehydrogenase/methenyltetrahydrofolate cyclohydrolase FolD [Prochlorococcus marinus]|uniref:Bifunctional protein FolD n=1 Tax=Prochlorococcus marinus XMU1408 TaxID=2213228 RepID=A0A318R022_PROMR|nr:bifunctional methylenetetrahydrofolate dehydrogenase/methenyltetrahydrofolate cyclohydrolase FolD [Prochlorococcus marinus]MBW3042289.1 bifunctional methylenetetrahydrofolate dehydrogenase/methenyltetrahydrofolate cyclohydrolase FolD [Prochlorococcus marinus str. XMU1408]PYE01677.1 bifunctional methylenetetrahydrofolate dehydrogenase/methenyltetrahydrofolate cyclohydrolase FolD [Prochlorococcus marinus XMU1408]
MANILDGKKLAQEIELILQQTIESGLEVAKRSPGLAVIRVGNDPASGVYVNYKEKACQRIGVKSFAKHLKEDISLEELIEIIKGLNDEDKVDGILLQLPLPSHLNEACLLSRINPDKDADGLHPLNLGLLIKGEKGPRSCTPAGVMALLKRNHIEIEGKRAVVVGRSILVGKPMALMLEAANATVTIAHSRTKDLPSLTREADLIVVAAGKPYLIGEEHIRENSIVIDVGIHRLPSVKKNLQKSEKTKLCGDVKIFEIENKVAAYSPVPGGVGPMTVTMLLANTVDRWQKHCGLPLTISHLLP